MGFSLTGTHVIFFIAAVIIGSTVSGVLITVTTNVTNSLSDRGGRIEEQQNTEFKIINDPNNIPNVSGDYKFYLKNIGGAELTTSNSTFNLFVDGEIIIASDFNFSDASIQIGEVTTIYLKNNVMATGDHILRIVGPQAVTDKFSFTV